MLRCLRVILPRLAAMLRNVSEAGWLVAGFGARNLPPLPPLPRLLIHTQTVVIGLIAS
jgi:hypothetical protein